MTIVCDTLYITKQTKNALVPRLTRFGMWPRIGPRHANDHTIETSNQGYIETGFRDGMDTYCNPETAVDWGFHTHPLGRHEVPYAREYDTPPLNLCTEWVSGVERTTIQPQNH